MLFRVFISSICLINRMRTENTHIYEPDGSLLLKYIRNTASEEERGKVESWLKKDSKHENIMLQLARIYHMIRTQERIKERNVLKVYKKIQKSIEEKSINKYYLCWSQLKYIYSIAASIALLCVFIGGYCILEEREKILSFNLLKENEYRECKDILLITDEDEVSINKDDVFIEYDTSGKANIEQFAYKCKRNRIEKKYNGKKDQASMMAMQEETQAVYEKYGVSMMGSCVQMLIQMPLLFALYRVFLNVPAYVSGIKNLFTQPLGGNATSLVDGIMATEGYQDTMTNLVSTLKITTQPVANFTVSDPTAIANSIVDVTYKMNSSGWDALKDAFPALSSEISSTYETVSHVNNFFGMNISDTPLHVITSSFSAGAYLMVIAALLVPIISYLTQVLNIKLMPQATASGNDQSDAMAQQMKMMNRMMPLFSLVMCFTVPVGLGIYWIAGAVVRVVQQYFLNKHFEKMNLEDIIKKNQEKAKKKREKMGIAENQISNAAKMNTRQMVDANKKQLSSAEKELEIEKANAAKSKAKAGSMSAKANMVREFNERNNRK